MPIYRPAIIVLVLLLAACTPAASTSPSESPSPSASASPSPSPTPIPTPATHEVTVSLDLHDVGAWAEGDLQCEGKGGFDDITELSQVVVRDGAGTILATAALGIGLHIEADVCAFITKVEEVPSAGFYSVEISHRGELVYSKAEMEANGWRVQLTLGDSA